MQLLAILFAGWALLSVVCFAMGSGLMRPERVQHQHQPVQHPHRHPRAHVPAPRVAQDDRVLAGR